jgi:hypothetical protein
MPRALTASRVTVPLEQQADYVATLARLAARMGARGEHLWLFRDPATPGAFLECSESPGPGSHRSRRAAGPEESALQRRLEAIASYAPEGRVLWEEVSLEER